MHHNINRSGVRVRLGTIYEKNLLQMLNYLYLEEIKNYKRHALWLRTKVKVD